MSDDLRQPLLGHVVTFIGRHLGLHFPASREGDLIRGLRASAAEFGFGNLIECVRWLLATPLNHEQIEVLAGNLTVGETYFYRDPRFFELLERQLLPALRELRASERRLRIWSAACCTGEEPYSLAMAVRQAMPDPTGWQISILGTDINPRFLQKAARGLYGAWSFRDGSAGLQDRWFTPAAGGRWQIAPELRGSVTFAPLNLVEDVYPSLLTNTNALDLIVCRNVLIYFSAEQAIRVVKQLALCLSEGGWLVLGPNDIPLTLPPELVREPRNGLTLFRRAPRSASSPVPGITPVAASPMRPTGRRAQPVPMLRRPRGTHGSKPPVRPAKIPAPSPTLAESLYEEGRYAETAAALTQARDAGSPAKETHLLVRALANQGRLEEALVACDRLIVADKMNALSHYLRASLLREQGKAEDAAAALQRATYLEPDFVLAHFALGNGARERARLAEASRHFDNALELLSRLPSDAPVPEADGLTAARLSEIIGSLRQVSTS